MPRARRSASRVEALAGVKASASLDGFRRQAHDRRELLRRRELRVLRHVVQPARRDLVQHRGRDRGEDAPERARVDRDGGLEDQTFVAGRQNSSIECTWPLGNTKAPKNSALTKAVTVGWITPNRPC